VERIRMEIVSVSPVMRQVAEEADLVARCEVSALLVTGEAGVGKEHLARFVHDRDERRERPFVVIDFAADSSRDDSERGRQGAPSLVEAFARADGGTLFLKGIQRLPAALQSDLMDHLNAGGRAALTGRARIICSASPSLYDDVQQGKFSAALYYRLNVIYLPVPPLRERRDDVVPLLQQFIADAARRQNVPAPAFQDAWREALARHQWPGNADELRDVAELIVAGRPSIPLSPSLTIH
jgi:DNA-binding NtrC family response regulator